MTEIGNDMDQPFEPHAPRTLEGEVQYAGGMTVAAAVTELPGLGTKPVLVFHFAMPGGGMYPPMALVCDDEQMGKVAPLVIAAVNRARRIAGRSLTQPKE